MQVFADQADDEVVVDLVEAVAVEAHVVREVAKHSQGGLDIWMADGLVFLEEHRDHSVLVMTKG